MPHDLRKLTEDVLRCIAELEHEILWDTVANKLALLKRDLQMMG